MFHVFVAPPALYSLASVLQGRFFDNHLSKKNGNADSIAEVLCEPIVSGFASPEHEAFETGAIESKGNRSSQSWTRRLEPNAYGMVFTIGGWKKRRSISPQGAYISLTTLFLAHLFERLPRN